MRPEWVAFHSRLPVVGEVLVTGGWLLRSRMSCFSESSDRDLSMSDSEHVYVELDGKAVQGLVVVSAFPSATAQVDPLLEAVAEQLTSSEVVGVLLGSSEVSGIRARVSRREATDAAHATTAIRNLTPDRIEAVSAAADALSEHRVADFGSPPTDKIP
jgi:hypothetical protein